MRKRKRTDSTTELYAMLQAAAKNHEFNIVADLKELQKQHGKTTKPGFKKLLEALVEKYTVSEYAVVHEELLKKCRAGDMSAIRFYHELSKDGAGSGEEVTIINDIG